MSDFKFDYQWKIIIDAREKEWEGRENECMKHSLYYAVEKL